MTRTTGQFSSGLGAGAALAMLVVWVLTRTIGLNEGEITFLAPVLAALFGALGAFLAPWVQHWRPEAPPTGDG